ncbi:sulfotransferase family protein [Rhabdochromatium marinum]|uniref:sulfotransferase family protein n=1 Tax=Rhabdochromatium marinum TaxID=48729 RepID=UPI001902C288|nr:sulfotransferase [Rhabdochromatium marinum]MBK1649994.1 sulfotransferase [Rhabdochromatium marinum]
MVPDPLIILSPPRSFSSVISTMLGEHPELYGFPELHVFAVRTVTALLEREAGKGNYSGPPGLLRALAQLHEGRQTTGGILRAGLWLNARRDWTIKALLDDLLAKVAPRIGIEKSPVNCMNMAFLANVQRCYPRARYVHLTRHPVATRASMQSFFHQAKTLRARGAGGTTLGFDHLLLWYRMHRNILEFTAPMPDSQVLRIKGEQLLSEPDRYLPQIAEWLGVRTDASAIAAMKHPERSPYACIGPSPARGGNDSKFMHNPRLRTGQVQEPRLADLLAASPLPWLSSEGHQMLTAARLKMVEDDVMTNEVLGLTRRLGYQ